MHSTQIADYLLDIQAVKLRPNEPFTWSSGWKSPMYCDNRLILSYPHIRSYVKAAFCDLIQQHIPQANAIAGVATAGIAHGALIADKLELSYCYVRTSAKSHGLKNLIEGRVETDKQYVVVEDLISTGGSSLKVIEALREAGANVVGTVAIFSYGFPQAAEAFAQAAVPLFTLTNLEALLQQADKKGYIHAADFEKIRLWQSAPAEWQS